MVMTSPSAPDHLPELDDRSLGSLVTLSRALHVPDGDVAETLQAVLAVACRLVPAAMAAGVNLMVAGRFEPQAILGDAPHALDALQQAIGSGPCIDASREQASIEIVDMCTDTRWPDFTGPAVELGVLSMLCVPLWVDELQLGSLSLYGASPAGFDQSTRNLAELLATHAALAIADAQRMAQLRQALVNRDTIGQAKGILMERHRITPDQAFGLLAHASQTLNRKLWEIAETVTLTGEVPAR